MFLDKVTSLSRRDLLVGVSASVIIAPAAASVNSVTAASFKRPKALKPQDRVAILCPAGAADGPEHIEKACEKVRSLALEPVVMPNALARFGYLGGTDQERAADLNQALRDSSIRGLFTLRGGYGAMRVLEQVDYRSMRRDPKILIGFSDITALHLAFLAKSAVITFHGPCAESSWSDFSRSTWPVLSDPTPFGMCRHPDGGMELTTLVPGTARGRLIGGNLSLIVSLLGTPFMPKLDGAILVCEDIGEEPYRVDRMLTQLALAGAGSKLRGLVFGNFRKRPKPGQIPEVIEPDHTFTMEQVLLERSKQLGIPAYSGLSFGHISDNHILPLGTIVEMDANSRILHLQEGAVVY
ncbi:MAG: LD-carboxypeptidase [Armatimonadetes bacterium]|nr:LD-carboxypeptidase [Armatimonadota bacterium]